MNQQISRKNDVQNHVTVVHNKPTIQTWWRLLRPFTLTASIVPVLIGTAIAMHLGSLDILLFVSMLVASIFIQSATNMFNEYYDYKRGLDDENSVGIGGAIVRDGVQPKTVLTLAFIFFGLAMLLGIYICMNSSWWIAVIGSISMAVGYFYTGGPYPIAYTPFGEVFTSFFMGPVIVLIAMYIHTGFVTWEAFLLSVPISILVAAILMANNIRDLDGDKEKGRRTLAIVVGREKARKILGFMFIVSYLWTVVLIVFTQMTPWLLLVLASLPVALKAFKGFKGKTVPIEMMPAMKSTAKLHALFGLLFSAALFLSYL